jgi:hypothetical protein
MVMKDVCIYRDNWCLKALLYYEAQLVHMEAGGFEEDDTVTFSGRFRKDLYRMMETWFREQIQLGKVPELIAR